VGHQRTLRGLEKIAERSYDLAGAFARVQGADLSAQFLREAWQQVCKCRDGDPNSKPFPDDLIETLRYLALAARIWQPDPKPAHAPKKTHGDTRIALVGA
jgi:hypothetical protein